MTTPSRSPSPPALALGVAVVFGLGVLVGLAMGRTPDAPPPPAPRPAPAPPPAAGPPLVTASRPEAARPVTSSRVPSDPDPTRPASPSAGAPDLQRVLDAARAARAAPDDDHRAESAMAAAGELEVALGRDPAALARALEGFRGLRDAGDLDALASVLGRIKDPEVEAAALDVARRDASPERRRAALDVLDALGAPAARGVALEVLARESDVELRRAALRALPEPTGVSLEEAAPVVAALSGLVAQDRDVELRRRAAATLGRWSRSDDDLAPLLAALERDPAPEVRTGAAFGLEVAMRRGPAVMAALARAAGKDGEDPLVRENAWRALGALGPLPPEARAAWAAFAARREAEGEATSGEDDHEGRRGE